MDRIARDLLALEMLAVKRKLTDPEAERWLEFVSILFGNNKWSVATRRSFRLSTNAKCTVAFDGVKTECWISEISFLNMTIVGDVFSDIAKDTRLMVSDVIVQGEPVDLKLEGNVVRSRTFEDESAIGFDFDLEKLEGKSEKFYAEIYFPLYIRYLEVLSNKNAAKAIPKNVP